MSKMLEIHGVIRLNGTTQMIDQSSLIYFEDSHMVHISITAVDGVASNN